MNRISFSFGKIRLELDDPLDWNQAKFLAGKVEEISAGVFEYALSTHNMQRIARLFTGPKKPVVVGGQSFLDELKGKLNFYKTFRNDTQAVNSLDRFPIEPNGKFHPYAHQTKIIGVALKNPYSAIYADCLLPGSLVLLDGSYKPIETAAVGQEILTMKGYSSVAHVTTRDYEGQVVILRTRLSARLLSVTASHRFPVVREGKLLTVKASEITMRDSFVIPEKAFRSSLTVNTFEHDKTMFYMSDVVGVTSTHYKGPVYNLTSAGDDSYLTDAGMSKNCGLGKTGAMGRSMEMVLASSQVKRGKILVSAPLSILHTSWMDDIEKFTSLKTALLWTPESNEKRYGSDKVILGNLGEKPEGSLKTKPRTGVRYRHNVTGEIREDITVLDRASEWTKFEAKWKVASMIDGTLVPYGDVVGRTVETLNTREQFIIDQLSRNDVDTFLINHDGVRIYEDILKQHKFEWVIVDESTKIKSPQSNTFRSHVAISWNCKRRNILSGTPNPNGFTDLWSQFYFLDRGMTIEPNLKDFLFEYFRPEHVGFSVKTPKGTKAAVKYVLRNNEARQALIDRVRSVGIFLEQRDCIDLPPRTDMNRIVYMTPEQEAAYDRMAIDLVTELKNDKTGISARAEAENVLTKIMKLRQITSGFLIGKESITHLDKNPKLEDLDDFIEELGKKVVIAAQFKEEINNIRHRYEHLGVRAIFGGVSVEERNDAIRSFQSDPERKVVVLQPQAAAHGITLTAASHLVFVSLDYNFEYYYQTAKRIERIGQKNNIFITHIIARFRDGSETVDESLIEVLRNKRNDRDALFSDSDVVDTARQLTSSLIRQVEKRHE